MTKVLNDKQIKQMIQAYVKYKLAENQFKRIKDELTKDLIPGKYESKYGHVTKTISIRKAVDYTAMLRDNPQINVEEYTQEKESTLITVHNYNI